MMGKRAAAVAALVAAAAVSAGGLAATEQESDGLAVSAGRALFRRIWVPAPSSTQSADGLGPLFNARSCSTCHAGGGGASLRQEPDGGTQISGAVVRVAGPEGEPHPWYGRQLQTGAVPGLIPEARVSLRVPAQKVETAENAEATEPSQPTLAVELLGPPLGQEFRTGVRIAPSLQGRALFGEIAESAIFARASTNTARADGVRGRVRLVPGPDGTARAGRFGLKAAEPDLVGQIASALAFDMGLSTPRYTLPYGDCMPQQSACLALPTGENPETDKREVSGEMLTLIASYVGSLTRPVAEDGVPPATFARIGCAACHVPEMRREGGGYVRIFSDALLHDMGDDLDDGVAEPGVASREWRTAPLVDLKPAGRLRRYLHDGRAADVASAVRWHGGEAATSREAFESLEPDAREALIRYLERL